MAMSGLDIFKLLPKTNCKDCGKPTCLAFAMGIAAKKAALSECPHVSDEAKEALEGASAPPIRLVAIGTGDTKLEVGQETVMFRHDEKFHHPTGVAIRVSASLDEAALNEKIKTVDNLRFERVGQKIQVDLIALDGNGVAADQFAKAAKAAADDSTLHLILMSDSSDAMKAALEVVADRKPLIYAANAENYEAMAALAKEKGCPLAVVGKDLEDLAELTPKVKAAGVEDLVIDSGARSSKAVIQDLTKMRRAALKKTFRPLGYAPITFATGDPAEQTVQAAGYVSKYAGIVVMDCTEPWQVLPVLTARMNIFTDPQKPIQVESKLYAIGEPDENSPLMFTTNFSLTYFTVEGDVEASRVPAWILSVDTEGTSVLTAYSGDKLNEQVVKKAMDAAKVEEVVKHRKLIIPGYVSVMSGKLEEATGWEIVVGPKESSFIPKFLQTVWKAG